ncbi:hypothetical protein IY145_04245 [Methylosinus sp. H3A]|uniref:hypothetical protein n=1 Tax=Methylosinus sp. H3A TaxID=2785786 RepID=UPI0018C2FBA2|nr:hypothetical protein [Methylosinus sp. H3A]MBG0808579.1 hypothetical protein [Methylosinus sp. H3A]
MTSARHGLAAAAGLAALLATRGAAAHCMIGPRMIPMTITIDTPCVMDDFMPMAMGTRNGDHTRELDVPLMFSKRITKDFGVTLAGTWSRMWMPENQSYMAMIMDMPMMGMTMPMLMPMGMYMPGMNMSGWQNLQTTFKYQLVTDKKSEFVLSAGLFVDWGGVGNRSTGAPGFTTLAPTIWLGKGFGDLPEEFGWARALAATGQFGLRIPTWRRTLAYSLSGMSPAGADMSGMLNSVMDMSCMTMPAPLTFDMAMLMPSIDECRHSPTFAYGASLQYSFSYLKKKLKVDLGVPDFVYELNPIVEVQFRTPLSGVRSTSIPPYYGVEINPNQRTFATSPTSASTVGTINPGLIWMGDKMQIGAEAIIPINRQSGRAVGWMASIDFSLQRLFPDTLGKPLIQSAGEEEEDHDHGDHDHGDDHDHGGHDHDHDHGDHGHGHDHERHHGGQTQSHGHAQSAGSHHGHGHGAHLGQGASEAGSKSDHAGHEHAH